VKRTRAAVACVAIVLVGTACRSGHGETTARADSIELARREAHLAAAMARPDSGATRGAAVARWVLGADLAEISGLALTPDGRLFTHGDEQGRVFELDYRRGVVVKRFTLGAPPVKADFEAIAVAGDAMYLLTSKGKLYQFQEGANGELVEYSLHDTRLRHECEFEGVAFDSTINSLLLACKNVLTKGALRDSLVVYRWRLGTGSGPRASRLTVPLAQVIGTNRWPGLHPSDITVDPVSGNYVLVAAEERALIEITPSGQMVFARPLPSGLAHAEGVAVTRDSLLIVSTEAGRHSAAITLYRRP